MFDKIKKYKSAWLRLSFGLGLMALGTESAMAVSVSQMFDNLNSNAGSVADGISIASYLVGAGSVFQSFMKFKEHQENPQQVKLKTPLTYLVVGGGLLALPTSMTLGTDTMYGPGGAQNQGLNQGMLR